MLKCTKCDRELSEHKATVRACPNCGRILDAEPLFRLLKELRFSEEAISKIRDEYTVMRLVDKISGK
jgi:hypothetical protein